MLLTSNLTKYYEAQSAVRDVNLFIPSGETCALIGPNGAGKTTLLKMLAGLLRPTSGRIEVAGIEAGTEPKRLHKIVGYVPDTFGLYDELTVRQFMDYFARAQNVAHKLVERRITDVLALTRLEEKRDALTGSLSRGMRQRLVIAKTLLHAPKVLLLDEPASGLDPHARLDLRDLIRELAAMGTTLIVSSHILTELADFSTTVVIMERGRVVRAGNIGELVREISNGIPVRIETLDAATARKIVAALREREALRDINVEDANIDGAFAGTRAELAQLHRLIVAEHDGIISFYERHVTIEDVFMAANSNRVA